ncbi:DUF1702 family protein [Candidatus Uabimicrobium amorphum]|uniref:Uncharacterized protein n=1 Tax=Uabimicrobium amorphum TaxID=2596890 RepID=A0A5S9ISK2_UABAM|nr:DUF1702 family protein [Candidatus Uabimicrobium amorphum]BBM87373.1 hypothetical protein UABAM_05782 [Candidatus Uabimicrobium amorphum]
MIRSLLAAAVNSSLQKFMKTQPQNIQDTLFSLQQGISDGIHELDAEKILANQRQFPWYKQLFYREGYAMGLAFLHVIKLRPGNPDKRHDLPLFRIMHYTGYGFYNGLAKFSRKVPFVAPYWRDIEDYDEFYPFLIGGETFGKTIARKKWDRKFVEKFDVSHNYSFYREAAWHGCGRSLWFKFNHDITALVKALELYPPATQELLLGVGVAITFTQIAQPQKVIADILRFPVKYHHALKEGAGISLATMTFEHPVVTEKLKELYCNELQPYFSNALHWGETLPFDSDWYQTTIYKIREENKKLQ